MKPATTYQEQIEILKTRGLVIPDEKFACHVLTHCNYYRLSAYRFPFTVPGCPDLFREGASFSDIWKLYEFDRNLRQLILEACKRIEISARSRWAYEIAHQLGPLAYTERKNYKSLRVHEETLLKIKEDMDRSREVFIAHHRHKLKMEWPPAWVISEVVSFGHISTLIGQHVSPAFRQSIADTYGLDESTFCSLIHHLTIIRNTAAHHSRLWNRRFALTMKLPEKKPVGLYSNFNVTFSSTGNRNERSIYNSLVMIVYMMNVIEPKSSWPQRLISLVDSLDQTLVSDMEFPTDWKTRPIWSAYTT
jgi:abortive infection bacteriophage resistance protein